jgi:cell division protein FtsW
MKRSDRSLLTSWWFQVDWAILGIVAAFAFIGLLSGIQTPHLLDKIILFYAAAAAIFLFVPMMNLRSIITASWVLFAACMILLFLTYAAPHSINHSLRWVRIAGLSLMPADLLKPAFIVLTAWFISSLKKRADDWVGAAELWRGGWWPAYLSVFSVILAAMFFHPDLGNMFMYLILLGAMIFWAGAKLRYILAIGLAAAAGLAVSFVHPHFRARLLGSADGYQAGRSLDAIMNGGLWGRGNESFLFRQVPMANNDFVFSGIAEMWGVLAASVMLGAMFWLFCILFRRAIESRDDFGSLIIFGAAFLFALHVVMNVLTAVGLFMKGTTLPFISYGGSSLLAFSLLFAIVLAVVRRDKWK